MSWWDGYDRTFGDFDHWYAKNRATSLPRPPEAIANPKMTTAERLREKCVDERTKGAVRAMAEGMLEEILKRIEVAAGEGHTHIVLGVGPKCPAVTVLIGLLQGAPHRLTVARVGHQMPRMASMLSMLGMGDSRDDTPESNEERLLIRWAEETR